MHLVHESRPAVRRERLLRLPEVESITGLKKSMIYLLMRRGPAAFPAAVKSSARVVAWPESAVLQWVQDRIAESQQARGASADRDRAE